MVQNRKYGSSKTKSERVRSIIINFTSSGMLMKFETLSVPMVESSKGLSKMRVEHELVETILHSMLL